MPLMVETSMLSAKQLYWCKVQGVQYNGTQILLVNGLSTQFLLLSAPTLAATLHVRPPDSWSPRLTQTSQRSHLLGDPAVDV